MIILNARIGAEAFYKKHGHATEGEPFDENTIPHIRDDQTHFWEGNA